MIRRTVKFLGESPPLLSALFGIVVAALIAVPALMLGIGLGNQYLASPYLFSPEDIVRLAWVGVVGAQGGAVSLVLRLTVLIKDEQPSILYFLNGLLKPFVGMSFAHFSYMVFASGLIAKPAMESRDIYFYVAVAFVAGFSERFARDLIKRIPGGGSAAGDQ